MHILATSKTNFPNGPNDNALSRTLIGSLKASQLGDERVKRLRKDCPFLLCAGILFGQTVGTEMSQLTSAGQATRDQI